MINNLTSNWLTVIVTTSLTIDVTFKLSIIAVLKPIIHMINLTIIKLASECAPYRIFFPNCKNATI